MLWAKEYPEDHSNSSTSPSHGREAHDHPSIVENCHRQSIKYWRNLSQAIIQNRIQENESWLHSEVTMTTTPFSFYATKSRVKKDVSLNHHTKMFECSSRILATFRWLTDSRKEIQGKEYWSYQGLALAWIRSKAIFSRPKQRGN